MAHIKTVLCNSGYVFIVLLAWIIVYNQSTEEHRVHSGILKCTFPTIIFCVVISRVNRF